MAQGRTQLLLLLFVGMIFVAISLAEADPSYGDGCSKTCTCSKEYSCRKGKDCCWSGYKCNKFSGDYDNDEYNCGRCGNKCKYGEICCKGQCFSASKFLLDSSNCGSCNNKCYGNAKTCCHGVCTDTSSDPKNCGKCGNMCYGKMCKKGYCYKGH